MHEGSWLRCCKNGHVIKELLIREERLVSEFSLIGVKPDETLEIRFVPSSENLGEKQSPLSIRKTPSQIDFCSLSIFHAPFRAF